MNNSEANSYTHEQQDLFTEDDLVQYESATTWQRFFNFLIDALLMQYGLGFATGYLVVKFFVAVSPTLAYDIFGNTEGASFILASYLIGITNYLIYYTICEKAFRGYTLGKLITGTRAVREDGRELTFKDALLRTLCRIVPFEPLSGFGTPWHDRWTKTTVIKTR